MFVVVGCMQSVKREGKEFRKGGNRRMSMQTYLWLGLEALPGEG